MKILIAEDEPLMRERLLAQLAQAWPQARVVAVAENGNDAWDAWLEHEPDVVFLDIQMPGLTGLEVARRIAERSHIVFVTAYNQHALEALQRGAVDYLLKPVELAALERTVERLRRRTQRPAALAPVLSEIAQAAPQRLTWLKASVGKRIRLINVNDVLFLQSDTKYTRVVLADGDALIRIALKDLLEGLDPDLFWQIHRGTIVNAHAIAAVERTGTERLHLTVKGSSEVLVVSRTFTHLFRD
ncbi:DNA-binding LytR/AlgR family response regulator [Duganella sp. 1224]|uniref:LytR/AlgR family response regulator transcription factor n=1 Tax=Duganella sp. 1224 TaxID=2587052 RepID=UPI0015C7D696|nr:LytTR family DNA-binding domain-containing protein [Duganella sp. 1224]NYE63123.1 DNA-binding LytR/AlgR family response regulator [Duganella sp. 1224]